MRVLNKSSNKLRLHRTKQTMSRNEWINEWQGARSQPLFSTQNLNMFTHTHTHMLTTHRFSLNTFFLDFFRIFYIHQFKHKHTHTSTYMYNFNYISWVVILFWMRVLKLEYPCVWHWLFPFRTAFSCMHSDNFFMLLLFLCRLKKFLTA